MAKQELASILSGDPLPVPPPIDDDGIDGAEQNKFNNDVINYLRRLTGKFTTQNMPEVTGVSGSVWQLDFLVQHEDATAEDFVSDLTSLMEYAKYGFTINDFTHRGYQTPHATDFTLRINGTDVTGTGDNTQDSGGGQGTFTCTAANVVVVGDRLQLLRSGTSLGPSLTALSLKITRT